MKFYNYLNEISKGNIDILNKYIHKNCQKYLKLIKDIDNNVFFRGMYGEIMDVKNVRRDRVPSGMKENVFKNFNKGLEENGHNRRDNTVIASSEKLDGFGPSNYIFPVGNFSYTGAKTSDINLDDRRTGGYSDAVEEYLSNIDTFDDTNSIKLDKPFKTYFHTDKGIKEAYQNGYEIGFKCEKYVHAGNEYVIGNKKEKILEKSGIFG